MDSAAEEEKALSFAERRKLFQVDNAQPPLPLNPRPSTIRKSNTDRPPRPNRPPTDNQNSVVPLPNITGRPKINRFSNYGLFKALSEPDVESVIEIYNNSNLILLEVSLLIIINHGSASGLKKPFLLAMSLCVSITELELFYCRSTNDHAIL